jgi:hypothetical protein
MPESFNENVIFGSTLAIYAYLDLVFIVSQAINPKFTKGKCINDLQCWILILDKYDFSMETVIILSSVNTGFPSTSTRLMVICERS